MHIFLILDKDSKPRTVEQVDEIVVAEPPDDPNKEGLSEEEKEHLKKLNNIVLTNMVHAPCREKLCLDNTCSKKYPVDFTEKTFFEPSSHQPIYRH